MLFGYNSNCRNSGTILRGQTIIFDICYPNGRRIKMSDANLIKDKIREEFEKGFPSIRKILSFLLDLLNKDRYPSLSDDDFYDIVGYTYKLNLDYKLNLKISFYPLYKDLKKKFRKLFGDEKWLEMEQHLIKNYGLFKEGFEPVDPSTNRNWKLYRDLKISAFLSELSSKEGLSYSEFFDIVGEALKSNPEFYMENLDGEVIKRVKKLYGDEKLKEMEKYLEKFRLYDFFSDLFPKEENQHLSDSEFFDIVGEAFKSNPEFYMENLDEEVRKRVKKLYGDEKLKEIVKYIFEKFSLYNGEQILFESEGGIRQLRTAKVEPSGKIKLESAPVSVSIKSGNIVVTNYRLIVQGKLKVSGGRDRNAIMWGGLVGHLVTGGSASRKRDKTKERLIDGSLEQELPCYGYEFSIQNHSGLEKMISSLKVAYGIRYAVVEDNLVYSTQINLPPGTSQAKVEEQVNSLFKLLCKDKNQVLNIIKEYLEMESPKRKRAELLLILRHLRTREEYQDISDSVYLDIVRETYRLNPQFFMDTIYRKMNDWIFPSFLSIKEEFIELIENLKKETE